MKYKTKPAMQFELILILTLLTFIITYPADIDTTLAFKVGKISVTRYELHKNILPLVENYFKTFNTLPPEDSLNRWKNNFIDQYYIAADAFEKGYYQHKDIEQMVNNMACYMLTKKKGLVEQRLFKDDVTLDKNKLPEYYKRQQTKYYFDFIKFKNKTQLQEILPDTQQIKTAEQFNTLVRQVSAIPGVFTKSVDGFPWPFGLVWDVCDNIYQMEPGQISDPIKAGTGIYLVHLKNIEPNEQNSYEEFEKTFPEFYEFTKSLWLMNDYEASIIEKSNMNIDTVVFNQLYNKLSQLENIQQIDTNSFSELMPKPLLTFEIDSTIVEKSVNDFLVSYKKQVLPGSLENKNILYNHITHMIIEDNLMLEAERLGLTSEDQFILDRKNYKNNLVCRNYEKNEIDIGTITQSDLTEEYQSQKENFKELVGALYIVLIFKNIEDADSSIKKLLSLPSPGSSGKHIASLNLPGLLNPDLTDTIDCLPCALKNNTDIELQDESGIVGPVKTGDQFKIYYRIKDPHVIYKPFEDVQKFLVHNTLKRRYAEARIKILPELRQCYTLTIYNIKLELDEIKN